MEQSPHDPNLSGQKSWDEKSISRARDQFREMKMRSDAATRALGLPKEDLFTVQSAIFFSRPPQILMEGELSDIYRIAGVNKEEVQSVLRVDVAARALVEELGLPHERRYEVLGVLWGESSEPSQSNFDVAMKDAVETMERETQRAREKLDLPPEKEEILMKTLYGESGTELRNRYRELHPQEPKE